MGLTYNPFLTSGFEFTAGQGASAFDFSTGVDGAAVLNGSNTYSWAAKSGNTYTLKRPVFLSSLTISAGVTLQPSQYRIFVSGTLTNAGTIEANGGDGGDALADAHGVAGAQTPVSPGDATVDFNQGLQGQDGGDGQTTNGSDGSAGGASAWAGGVNSVAGNGGDSGLNTGGVGGAPSVTLYQTFFNYLTTNFFFAGGLVCGGLGSPGGGGGAGDGMNPGGGGGGGGAAGDIVAIFTNTINNTGVISANGGAGGAGADGTGGDSGGGGGGSGGGGGLVYIVAKTWTAAGTITANGGAAGAGGLGVGTGTDGSDGADGGDGPVLKYDTTAGAWL